MVSRHNQKRSIDITIAWFGTLTITDFDGVSRKISADPRNGFKPQLIEAGRSFGVIRLVSDPPHWLDDGH